MHNWAKRGLRTALVTGGLLMLGTGIASADERVDPDTPPSPLDGGVSVPVKVGNINLGTPFGSHDIPVIIDETISTGSGFKDGGAPFAPYFKNNVLAPNVLVPVEATGMAIAAGGDAGVVNESQTSHSQGGDIITSGKGGGLAGNVVAPSAAVPVQATGIAFPLLGTASVVNNTDQSSTAGGSVSTDGDAGAGSGNIVAPQFALPVAVNNTAAGWFAGVATVDGTSKQAAYAPGSRDTSGDASALGGNVVSPPVAIPGQVDGTAGSWGGIATAVTDNTAVAEAGTAGTGARALGDPYATTSGDGSVVGGNAVTPQAAGLAAVNCTAGSWVGISTTECTNDLSTESGGDVTTSGTGSALGGNIADADAALPVTVLDTAGSWGGMATANGADTVASEAGGVTTTEGTESTLGGNIVGAPIAGPTQVNGTAGAWIGMVESVTDNTTVAEAGNAADADGHDSQGAAGYANTAGDDSVGGGNIVAAQGAPLAAVDCTSGVWGGMSSTKCSTDETSEAGGNAVTSGTDSTVGGNIVDADAAIPATAYDTAGAWIGESDATGTNVTATDAGGRGDSDGTDSVLGGNTVRPMLASPVEVLCTAGVWGGTSTSECTTEQTAEAGAHTHTYGDDSLGGGNMVDAPVSVVSAVNNTAGSWIGDAEATQDNVTDSASGGGAYTEGDDSVLGGNQAAAPVAGAADVICNGGTWVGEADSVCTNDETVTAGEYNGSTGDGSIGGGNLVTTPQAPIAEVFGVAGAWGGDVSSTTTEDKTVSAGGAANTSDDDGVLASNVASVPWAPTAQVSNIAAAWIGNPTSIVDSDTTSTAGGDTTGTGAHGTGSGNIAQAPAALPADVHTIAATWGGNALAEGTHATDSTAGGDAFANGEDAALSGNIVSATGAGAANVYGGALSWIGNNYAESDKTLVATSGGDTTSSGTNGSLSGNQVLADANPVAQVFGAAGSFVANNVADTDSATTVTSGGDAIASGDYGSLSGDIVDADAQAPWQVHGLEAVALGNAVNSVSHETSAVNGGDNAATGDFGSLAGDVVNADAQAPAQVFGLDAVALGNGSNTVSDSLSSVNGGSSSATGESGALSGDIVSAEGQALPQVFGFGVSALGNALQETASETTAVNGGDLSASGAGNQFSGSVLDVVATADPALLGWAASAFGSVTNSTDNSLDAANGGTATSIGGTPVQIPLGLAPQISNITIPIAATIVNSVANNSTVFTANQPAMLLPAEGLMSADALPSGFGARSGGSDMPTLPADVPVQTSLPTVEHGLAALPETGAFSGRLPMANDLPSQTPALSDLDTMEMLRVPGGLATS